MATATFKRVSTATTNAVVVVADSTELRSWYLLNNNVSAYRYLKLYDQDTAPNPAIDEPKLTIGIPPGSGANLSLRSPLEFGVGIAIVIVTGAGDTSVAVPAANEVVVNLGYRE